MGRLRASAPRFSFRSSSDPQLSDQGKASFLQDSKIEQITLVQSEVLQGELFDRSGQGDLNEAVAARFKNMIALRRIELLRPGNLFQRFLIRGSARSKEEDIHLKGEKKDSFTAGGSLIKERDQCPICILGGTSLTGEFLVR